MPNFFDSFDEGYNQGNAAAQPAAQPPASRPNFFDQFDEPNHQPSVPRKAPGTRNFFDEFDESLPAEDRAGAHAANRGGNEMDVEIARTGAKLASAGRDFSWRDPVRSALQGATFGWSDEIGAAVAAPFAAMATGNNVADAYRDMSSDMRSQQDAYREAHPGKSLALELGGGIASGGAALAKVGAGLLGKGAAALPKRLAVNAALGAAEGGVAGAGYADEGDAISGAVTGAAVGGAVGAVAGEAINYFQRSSAAKSKIASLLRSDPKNSQTARYYLDGAGKVRTDKIAAKAVDYGMDEGAVAVVKGANATDKQKMLKMLDVAEKSQSNRLFAMTHRTADVAGESLMDRVGYLKRVNKAAGHKLDRVAEALKGQQVDYAEPVNKFLNDLQSLDIKVDPQTMRLDFQGSMLEGLKGPQQTINRVLFRMKNTQTPDAWHMHRMKKFLDEGLDYDKASGTGLTKRVEGVLKSLRHNIDSTLDANFPEYNQVNTAYSETINALNMLQKGVGKSVNLSSDLADKSTGKALRKVLSNQVNRENLMDALTEVDRVAKSYSTRTSLSKEIGPFLGGVGKSIPKFDDDLMTQVMFAGELDNIFGTNAQTSFRGEVARGVKDAAKDTVKGNKGGLVARSVDWAADKVMPEPTSEQKIQAFRELLSSP
ncbi:MAG: hypothetical protein M0Q95_17175 [Porticoccaceae bacterium]|nr:hypothetical protein [Porticoccaceae bacterium]